MQDNVPSGSDYEYRDWLNLSAMDDINTLHETIRDIISYCSYNSDGQ